MLTIAYISVGLPMEPMMTCVRLVLVNKFHSFSPRSTLCFVLFCAVDVYLFEYYVFFFVFFYLCDAMSIFILRYTTIISQTLRRTARDRPFLLCEGKRRNFYPCRKLNSMNACKSENKPFSDGLWCERDMCSTTIHIHRRTLTNVTILLVPNGKKVKQTKCNWNAYVQYIEHGGTYQQFESFEFRSSEWLECTLLLYRSRHKNTGAITILCKLHFNMQPKRKKNIGKKYVCVVPFMLGIN